MLYQEQSAGEVSNLYNIKVINKTRSDIPLDVKLIQPLKGRIEIAGGNLRVLSGSKTEGVLIVYLSKEDAVGKVPVTMEVYAKQELIEEIKLTFVGPE